MSERYSTLGALADRAATLGRIFRELRKSGLLWLFPLVAGLLLLAALLAVIASTGPLAPFLYPLL